MKVIRYKCENCDYIRQHIDMYNDKYCYDCISIQTGKLKEDRKKDKEKDEKPI